ncbi:MAG: aminoglycoside phosphotransferase family protein [Defluviitaleaceae bacterium]|nr:aminoglycoside phosphotransferase family protein [Defluviitaleaceae bacterium]MCL2275042.1 aminoglycoside phosphotransferase family protein [Defluviitaleaceae bacterium]
MATLVGGSMNQVEKIGDTIHKTSKGHIMVREYLQFLETEDFAGVPRFMGVDLQGREMFSYLPGKTMGADYPHDHPVLHSDQTICDMARFMRKLHDVSVGFLPRAREAGWQSPYFPNGTHETICHGDAAIWNFAFENDQLSGLFDFDQAYPGTRMWDLASTVAMAVYPFYYNYDPAIDAEKAQRQTALFFEAYGMPCPAEFMDIVIDRIQRDFCEDTAARAAAGDKECIAMLQRGDFDHYMKFIAFIQERGHEWRIC